VLCTILEWEGRGVEGGEGVKTEQIAESRDQRVGSRE
jgi:hypothetical protein